MRSVASSFEQSCVIWLCTSDCEGVYGVLLAPSHLLLSWRIRSEEREKGINQIGLMDPLSVSTSAWAHPLPSLPVSSGSTTLLSAYPNIPDLTVNSGCCFKCVFEKINKKKGDMVNGVILSWSCHKSIKCVCACVPDLPNAYVFYAVTNFSRSWPDMSSRHSHYYNQSKQFIQNTYNNIIILLIMQHKSFHTCCVQ